jgi:DNA-binding IclR family transcriptional regulator
LTSFDRMLTVLRLFSVERPLWTVDEATAVLGGSRSTTYRYFRSLTETGLLDMIAGRAYTLGPNIIELDRLIRLCDPLLTAVPAAIAANPLGPGQHLVVHRLFRDRVVCVYVTSEDPSYQFFYARGERVPLFTESTSLVMLAHLPWRRLKDLYRDHLDEAQASGIGGSWDEFRSALTAIRRIGHAETSHAEIGQPARVRVSAPIFDGDGAILAGVSQSFPENAELARKMAVVAQVKAVAQHATGLLARSVARSQTADLDRSELRRTGSGG